MSAFGQFDAGYNLQEDRILLRITNADNDEYRLWLTRRLCESLLTDFKTRTSAFRVAGTDSFADSVPITSSETPDHDTLLRAHLEQQASVAQQDFATAFIPGERFPLGEEGMLVEKINLQPNGQGKDSHSLSFTDVNGKGITLGISIDMFNSIFEVIERVVKQTNWNLSTMNVEARSSTLLQ